MTPGVPCLPLAEGATLRWEALPPAWVLVLVLVPATLVLVALAYRREKVDPRRRLMLAAIRVGILIAALLLLFGPFFERTVTRRVRSHVLVLVDTSSSMDTRDEVDAGLGAALSRATGVPADRLATTSRLELARRALLHGGPDAPLARLADRFVTHVYAFDQDPRAVWHGDEDRAIDVEDGAGGPEDALAGLVAEGSYTRLGDSVMAAVEDFRLREDPLSGVIVLSDGRQTSGQRLPREAGEHARNFQQRNRLSERGIPILAVIAGDPSSSRNVQVRNLVAPEVVLARDDALFEFDVVQSGFDGEVGVLRLMFLEPRRENATLDPGETTLMPGENGTPVKARYRFDVPGTYLVRVGVPPLPGERVTEDNWVEHRIRVVDRKVRVLYVDGRPRREWESLQRALTRDADTMLVHTLQLESAREVPQPRTDAPGWPALPGNRFPATRTELFEYDVIVMGDVDWRALADTPEDALQRLKDIQDFVEAGGGLLCIAGDFHMPEDFRRTPIAEVLPIVVDPDEARLTAVDTTRAFNLALTPEGRESPLLRIHDDAETSARLWEDMPRWGQYWYYPPRRAAAGARVLAVHPEGLEGAANGPGRHGNRYGPHVLIATKTYGLGRCLWLGMEEFWRMRYGVGDQFYYGFYAKAIRYLASYRLLGGNKRVKLHPERQIYFLDEPVGIVAHVVGEDYRPPSPVEKPVVRAVLTLPDRSERALELLPVPQPEGETPRGVYRATFTATAEGTYTVAPDPVEVPGETPEGKSFQVQASAEERKDPSVDEEALRQLAVASAGGRLLALDELSAAVDELEPQQWEIDIEARPDPLSDQWWVPLLLTLALGTEWILRKRWRLL